MESPAHRSEFFVDLLEGETVGSLCGGARARTLSESDSLRDVIDAFADSNQEIYPVVDQDGNRHHETSPQIQIFLEGGEIVGVNVESPTGTGWIQGGRD